jgi:hypothetical protein
MARLPTNTRTFQADLLKQIDRADDSTTHRDIARAAGVDASMVSKWKTEGEDGREMPVLAAVKMADEYGWDVVFGRLAREKGFEITRRPEAPADLEDLPRQASRLSHSATGFTLAVHEYAADGLFTDEEVADLELRHRQLLADVSRTAMARRTKRTA